MKTGSFDRRLSLQMIAAAGVAALGATWHGGARAQAAPPAPATQTSADGGVTLKVTPGPMTAGATEWEFGIVLDTHSASLDDDLMQAARLIVDGREFAPIRWTGAAAGGHHREGKLSFALPQPLPQVVELRIQRSGEAQPRVFRWDAAVLR